MEYTHSGCVNTHLNEISMHIIHLAKIRIIYPHVKFIQGVNPAFVLCVFSSYGI